MLRTFKVYFLSHFKIYDTVLLIIVTMPYATFLQLNSSYNCKFVLFDHLHPFLQSWQLPFSSLFHEFNIFIFPTYKRDHTVFVFLSISLTIMPLGLIHVDAKGRIFFFFLWLNIHVYMYIRVCIYNRSHFLYSFIHRWTCRWFSCLGYCK